MNAMDSSGSKHMPLIDDSSEEDQEGEEKNNHESEEESKGKESEDEKEYKSIHEIPVYSLAVLIEASGLKYDTSTYKLLFSDIETEIQPPEIS